MKKEKEKFKKIAILITDNFYAQITDLFIDFDIDAKTEDEEDKKVDEVIKEIIKIYK